MHGVQQHLPNAFCTLRKKCIRARACAHMQQYRKFFVINLKLLRTYLESCASIVQAVTVLCRLPNYCLDQTRRLTLFAQQIRLNLR